MYIYIYLHYDDCKYKSHVQYCQDPERNGKLNPLDYLPSETPTELNRMPLAQ